MNKKEFKAFTRHIVNVYNEQIADGKVSTFITNNQLYELIDKAYAEYLKLPTEPVEV